MTFERRIRIDDRYNYFLGFDLKYTKQKFLERTDGGYFDLGDLSIMIEEVEKNFSKESKKIIYDKGNFYMNNVIYLYDRFPFIAYIRDILYNDEGKIIAIGYITKKEIVKYIKNNKIEINRWDKNNCRCPLLYK
ncbi:MAG: hypothetical protein IKX00_03705 [Bacilli bacterium]|nr:hypothetical protein [Bacilli bacterium]